MPRQKQPNVLLIMTDQQRADGIGAAGNPAIRTPNIDRIAQEGVLFSSAFCSNPFCMPSRASVMTGRYAHAHGTWDNGVPLPEDTVTLAGHLADQGYRTLLIGKGHLNVFRMRGSPESFDDWSDPEPRWADWHGPYYGFNEVHMAVGHHKPSGHYGMFLRENHPEAIGKFPQEAALESPTGAFKSWKSAVPVEAHASTWIGDQTLQFLDRAGDEPFFGWISFPDPHLPFTPPAPHCHQYDPNEIPYPRQQEGELDDKPPHFQEFFRGELVSEWGDWDRPAGDFAKTTEAQYREVVAHYYGMISLIDDNVGRILRALDEKGLAEDTIVIFTSDHGELLGDHFLIGKGAFHYDSLIRVPLLWRFPEKFAGGLRLDGQVSLIDIAPTVCDLVGAPPLPDMHGRSLVPMLSGGSTEGRDAVMVEFEWRWKRGMPLRTIRTPEWKLNYYAGRPYGELYNLKDDPDEFVNLYDRPELAEVQDRLIRRLADETILTAGYLPKQICPHGAGGRPRSRSPFPPRCRRRPR